VPPPCLPAPAPAPPTLTVPQLVGQHMVFAYDGLVAPQALRRRIARGEAAGVILFARNVRSAEQVRGVVRGLQAIRRPPGLRAPLLVMADQEGGPVRRIPGGPVRAAADVATARQARADGRAAARTLRAAGVNMDLAPVADVARSGSALARERRVYGASPARVASLAAAFARGLHAGNVRATAKHYPGFGAAGVNTDNAPVRIGATLGILRAVDEPPFAALIAGGVDAVMASTAIYPALDGRPAAFSGRWIGGELRGRLRFGGVVVADDLATPAVDAYGSLGHRAVLAVGTGVDLPLFAGGYASGALAAEGLLAAARRGELGEAALRAGAQRVLELRQRLPR
jgi:beta-N-acetylhexosaminidase